jgi:hypothetical protein
MTVSKNADRLSPRAVACVDKSASASVESRIVWFFFAAPRRIFGAGRGVGADLAGADAMGGFP